MKNYLEIKEKIKFSSDFSEGGEQIPCRAGKSTFWVTWDGKMAPCGMMTKPMFEIDNFNDAWECVKKSREEIYLPSECKTCDLRSYCDICAAIPLAEAGEFGAVPDYICKKAAEYKKLCEEFMHGTQ